MMYVIQFMGMISEKFGAIEKYSVELSFQLKEKGYKTIFVYNEIPSNIAFVQMLEANNSKVIELNVNRGIIRKIWSVFRILNRYRPEIIHCHFTFPLIRIIIFLSWILHVSKRFVTFHSMPGSSKMITRLWQRILGKLSTKLIAVSEAVKNQLVNFSKVNESKILILRLGIDFTEIENIFVDKKNIRQALNLPQDKIIIGCVAFHQPIKGIDILLRAVSILKHAQGVDNIKICQIGGFQGNYIDSLKALSTELDIRDDITWFGIRDNIPEIMLAFDIYCQPSRSEGLPLAILEAYATGLPVVASRVGGIPEIVRHNQTGYLVEPENAYDLADKLLLLINNIEKGKEFGYLGKTLVRKEYDRNIQVSRLIEVYIR